MPVYANHPRLLTNHTHAHEADVWEKARAATNAPVIIGRPGGPHPQVSAVGLWVDGSFDGDLSYFWAEVERIKASGGPGPTQ